MKPQPLTGFEQYGKTTRRGQLLSDTDSIIAWTAPAAAVQPAFPKVSEQGGRPPIALERVLRIYFLRLWFNPPGPAVEEALYQSVATRNFAWVDLGVEDVPDMTLTSAPNSTKSQDRQRDPEQRPPSRLAYRDTPCRSA